MEVYFFRETKAMGIRKFLSAINLTGFIRSIVKIGNLWRKLFLLCIKKNYPIC